ncbi:GLUG motif-containing protein [Lysinibacillus sp. NPDC097162]|uniref:GLUG motif-containing protein n=1 Tax=Lysinibacillus sp. NPDC097162 TaxID=3364140 RepID=UPI0037F854F7
MANGLFGGGDGAESSPFLVEDSQDLNAIRNNLSAHYKQKKNIDLKVIENFEPIGSYDTPFTGIYDGSNLEINNLKIENEGEYTGFFAVCEGAILKGISIKNATIKNTGSYTYAAILVGEASSQTEITDCLVNGVVEVLNSGCSVGGLVSQLYNSTINKCASVNSFLTGFQVGGLLCYASNADIQNSYTTGNLTGYSRNANSYMGSFATSMYYTTVKNCFSSTQFSVDYSGTTNAPIFYPFANQQWDTTFNSCYTDTELGGALPWMPDCYYYSDNIAKGTDGSLYICTNSQSNVDYEYWDPAWNETGPPPWWPGPFTRAQPTTGDVWQEYWQEVTSSTLQEGRNTAQMKTKANYEDWDFENIWTIVEGVSYPTFKLKRAIKKCKRVPLTNYRR